MQQGFMGWHKSVIPPPVRLKWEDWQRSEVSLNCTLSSWPP